MARLLIVHHTASPSTQAMLEAVLDGARTDEVEGVEVVTRAALAATAVDVLAADAVILGTPANIGYMSGALKHFTIPSWTCRATRDDKQQGRPRHPRAPRSVQMCLPTDVMPRPVASGGYAHP